jgi:glycosyltransferase involved in cell wall biosynthesis
MFSVALCTYNGAQFLPEQFASYLSQKRQPDEIVICDDGSTDETINLCQAFAERAPFLVRVEVNGKHLGVTNNFEKTISLCEGDLIALSDQDDIWHSEKLQKLEEVFLNKPGVGVVFSDGDVINELSESLGYRLWQGFEFGKGAQERVSQGKAFEVLLRYNVVTGTTMAFRSMYRPFLIPIPSPWIHDAWIALLIAAQADLSFVPAPLIRYRKHGSQQVGISNDNFLRRIGKAYNSGCSRFAVELRKYELARERLMGLEGKPVSSTNMALLESKIAHLKVRSTIPERRLERLCIVLNELVSRRYHKYSEGFLSVARDIFLSRT